MSFFKNIYDFYLGVHQAIKTLVPLAMIHLFVNIPHSIMSIQKLFMKLIQCDYII
jgi:hypothetical protein